MSNKFAWSYSRLSSFETCPKKYYHAEILKDFKDGTSLAMAMGTEAHRILEENIKDGTPIPPDYSVTVDGKTDRRSTANWNFVEELATLKGERHTEFRISLTKDLKITGWYDSDAWVRGIIDLAILHPDKPNALIVDYKTGRRNPDNDQLKLFAALSFVKWPHLQRAVTSFIWCKTGEMDSDAFHRRQEQEIWDGFAYRVQRMATVYETDRWDANPSGLCKKWCPVKTCKFNGDYRK